MTAGPKHGDRRGSRLADMTIHPDGLDTFFAGLLERLDEEGVEDVIVTDLLPGRMRVTVVHKWVDTQLVGFSIKVEGFDAFESSWCEIARADTAHEEAHIHWFRRGQTAEYARESLRPLHTLQDVGLSLDEVWGILLESPQVIESRWNG